MPTNTNSKQRRQCPECGTDWVKQKNGFNQCRDEDCEHRWCSCGGKIQRTQPVVAWTFLDYGWGHCKECGIHFYCENN